MTAFLGVAVVSLAILWPRPWELTANPREMIETYVESDEQVSAGELHRDLSLHMHASFMENQEGLERLASSFQVASVLLAVEVGLLLIVIALT